MWAHPTVESDGGASGWPTPRESESYQGDGAARAYREAGFKQPTHRYDKNGKLVVREHSTFDTTLTTAVQAGNWPTPTATERENDTTATPSEATLERFQKGEIARVRKTRAPTLTSAVQQGEGTWSTPRVSGQEGYETRATRKGHDIAMSYLESQAEYITENWATPRAADSKGSGPTVIRKDGKSRMDKLVYQAEQSQLGPQAPQTQTHGSESSASDQTSPRPSPKRLNPNFVEWMMGVPIGWTDLRPMTE